MTTSNPHETAADGATYQSDRGVRIPESYQEMVRSIDATNPEGDGIEYYSLVLYLYIVYYIIQA
jgi:hypothetical protein